MLFFLIGMIYLAGGLLAACAVDSHTGIVGTGNTARITGRVEDSARAGVPAEVRLVRLDSAGGVVVDSVAADADGSFEFDLLPAGLYRIVVDQDSLRGAVVDSIGLARDQKRNIGSIVVNVYIVQQVFVTINNVTIQNIYINYPGNPVPQRGDSIVLRALPGDSQVVYIAVADGGGTKLLRYRLALVDGTPVLLPLDGAPAAQVDPGAADTLDLIAVRDVSIDREGWNSGMDLHVRLYHENGVALLDFGAIDSAIAGRKVVSARLLLHGWIVSPSETSYPMVANVVSEPWIEGTGNWYWFDGTSHNGYATAVAHYPDYVPPQDAENPATASGIRWSTSAALRAGLVPVANSTTTLPEPGLGFYPLPKDIAPVSFDVTTAVAAMSTTGARTFGITRGGSVSSSTTTGIFFYSRENPAGPQYAPHLVLVLE